MKHIKNFKIFEARENPHKLDGAVLKRLERGVSQGYLKSYDIDFDKKKIHVKFVDPAYGKDRTYDMETYYPEVYDYKTGNMKTTNREMHRLAKHHDTNNYRDSFEHSLNDAAKKFVKANKVKGVVDDKGKMHPDSEILDLLKQSNCKAYQLLTQKLQLIPVGGYKTGKLEFVTKKSFDRVIENTDTPITEIDSMSTTEVQDLLSGWALYSISKGGKIYKLTHPPQTIKSIPPLNSVKDYENALGILYDLIYTKPMLKWKAKYEKEGAIALEKMPLVYVEEIAPKLATMTKLGIFDGEE